jgi:hypothetical protein
LYGLKHLSLHHHYLLKGWQEWWVPNIVVTIINVVVVVGLAAPGVGHLKNKILWDKQERSGGGEYHATIVARVQ